MKYMSINTHKFKSTDKRNGLYRLPQSNTHWAEN